MKFFRQYSIGPYILDFYCPTLKLAIELDGGQHNQPENRDYDSARSEYLKAQGIEVTRFWDNEVLHDIQSVLAGLTLKATLHNPPPLIPQGDEGRPPNLMGIKARDKNRTHRNAIRTIPAPAPDLIRGPPE